MKQKIKIIASIIVLALFYVAAISSGSSSRSLVDTTVTSGNHSAYDSASGKE